MNTVKRITLLMVIIAQLFQPLLAEGRMVHGNNSDSQPVMHSMDTKMAMQHQLHQMHAMTMNHDTVNSTVNHSPSSMMEGCCETTEMTCDSRSCADHQCTVIAAAPLFAINPFITLSFIEQTFTVGFNPTAMVNRDIVPEQRPPLV